MGSLRRCTGYVGLLSAVVAVASLLGCGGTSSSAGAGDSASRPDTSKCRRVDAPRRRPIRYRAPKQTIESVESLTAIVKTSCGIFEILLDPGQAPKTVNSFVFLSEEGFYDGLTFDRVEPHLMIQAGDPLGEGTVGGNGGGIGTGGPGYRVDEKPPRNLRYEKGTVAMLQRSPPLSPPGHSGSQFFILTIDDPNLIPIYAPLGKVSKGFDVVERIAALGAALGGRLGESKRAILIENVTIERR